VEIRDLYDVLDYILNHAGSAELDAIRAALRKREAASKGVGEGGGTGALGADIRDVARSTAEQIQGQVGASRDEIRGMVRRMVRRVIVREAPNLSESEVDRALSDFVPDPTQAAPTTSPASPTAPGPSVPDGTKTRGSRGGASKGNDLPRDAIIEMVGQFVAYSTGSMPVHEEMELTRQIGSWQSKYWERFPQIVRRLVSLFLKGTMDSDDFWRGIDDALS
jgi:hypothetical protein